ncbi:hypothetical protein KFU94_60285 [Chloroflexi bacterium TSY]|nr:hypothetical protein [Chloroflexi bacterium TSY]
MGTGILLSGFLAGIGWVLFGLTSLLVSVLPRWPLIMVIAGNLLLPFVPVVPALLAGVGFVWLGYHMKQRLI